MKSTSLPWGLRLGVAGMFAACAMLASADQPDTTAVGVSTFAAPSPAVTDSPANRGYAFVEAGKYRQALLEFDQTLSDAKARKDVAQEAEIHGAAGYTYYLMRRADAAEKELDLALEMSGKLGDAGLEGRLRAYRGLFFAQSEDTIPKAREEFERSLSLARDSHDTVMEYAASLQLSRLESSPAKRLEKLQTLASTVMSAAMQERSRVNLLLNIADQLKHLQDDGPNPALDPEIRQLGHAVAEKSVRLAEKNGWSRAQSQMEGYEAEWYGQDGKIEQAIATALAAVQHAGNANAPDLAMKWESDLGRLLARQGQNDQAIEAYRRAVFHVSEIRNDIPVTYQNGKSSYTETLEPIYRGLADLLMREAARASESEEEHGLLLETINTLEKLKQSEMEDYFNDRCALESAVASHESPPQGQPKTGSVSSSLGRATGKTAILYPIIFADRMEVLLVNNGQIHHKTVPVSREQVTQAALALSKMLRKGGSYRQILNGSRQLYQWVLEPMEPQLRAAGVNNLIYIPDGKLRLAPLAVLYDGQRFAAENFSVMTNSGLQFSQAHGDVTANGKALLAGLSLPDGPSLEQIPNELLYGESSNDSHSRGLDGEKMKTTRQADAAEINALKSAPNFREKAAKMLALPGVAEEIRALEDKLPNKTLLNQTFTSNNLEDGIQSGDFALLHISSHGYFGHSALNSFILTYDKALGVSEVERIMRLKPGQGHHIDLVTFSACQTAAGDDRAPLGFSGIAIKANARNALGSLWPIDDKATKHFMKEYYTALAAANGNSAKALQEAQKAMIAFKSMSHPSYWAAFVLAGAW